jgi:F0F1-type ATP synthase membrane subunit b/b'
MKKLLLLSVVLLSVASVRADKIDLRDAISKFVTELKTKVNEAVAGLSEAKKTEIKEEFKKVHQEVQEKIADYKKELDSHLIDIEEQVKELRVKLGFVGVSR